MSRRFRKSLLCAAVAAVLAGVAAGAASAALPNDLKAVKKATAQYRSIDRALADGYSIEGQPCVQEAPGTMGIHAVNAELASDLDVNPLHPEILLYLPDAHGNLRLVGVEYFVPAVAHGRPWFGADPPVHGFDNPAPSVLGQRFDGPMPGHTPTMPWHYDLHVWVWAHNPAGLFAPFNPALSCP